MMRPARFAQLTGLIFGMLLVSASAEASGLLELGQKPSKDTIVPIGSAPVKKSIPLELGALRTEEAQLPPAPLTRSERMALRAKRAVSRQRAVSNARRHRAVQRQQPTNFDEDEGFPVDSNGEPILE